MSLKSGSDELFIRITYEDECGNIVVDNDEYPLSDFGGSIPCIGDKIISPYMTERTNSQKDWKDPSKREIWEVVDRYFWPVQDKKYLALVVKRRVATNKEIDLL